MADAIATFQSITGADSETAEQVVESFGGDLDRAVNFFLENGQQGVATLQSFRHPAQPQAAAQPATYDLEEEDDEPILVPSSSPEPDAQAENAARQEAAAAAHRHNHGWLEEEEALQRALDASKVTAGGAGPSSIRGTSTPGGSASLRQSASEWAGSDSDVEEYEPEMEEDSDLEMDTEEGYMAKLAAAQAAAQARRRAAHGDNGAGPSGAAGPDFFGGLDDDDAGPRIRSNRPSGAAAAASQHLQNLNAFSQRLGIPMPPMPGMGGPPDQGNGAGPSGLDMPAGASGGAAFAGGRDAGLPDMPAGVNVEEARMLEAAMLGIPYTGRMPDFGAGGAAEAGGFGAGGFGGGGAAAGQPLSPGVHGTRALREEQDWAYQESLQNLEIAAQADRQKAVAEEAAQRAAEEESARMAAEAEAKAAAATEAEALRVQTLADKAQALPPEPPAGSADTVSVLIRMPDGQRRTRRFLKTDRLQSLYDFVDTSEPGEELQPGSYLLVTNMPRKVYEETTEQTLADTGLSQKQEMLLLEPKGR